MTEPCGAAGVDDGVFVGVGAVEVTTVAAEIVVTIGTVSAETVMSVVAVVGVGAEAITTVDLGTVGPVAATLAVDRVVVNVKGSTHRLVGRQLSLHRS